MTIADLLKLRAELLLYCAETDTLAAELRERGQELDVITRTRFRKLDDLRLLERQIAKLREVPRG